MSVDPSHYLPAANGGKPPLLKLQNISARPELNGQFGQAVSFSAGRYVVAVLDATTAAATGGGGGSAAQPTFLKLKPENLTEAGSLDQLKFGASMLLQSAMAYAEGPAVQACGERIHARLPPSAREKMTPNSALLAVAAAALAAVLTMWLVAGKLFGFQKVFVLASLVGLVLAVSSPDWTEGYRAGKPLPLIAKSSAINFRRRWKENLVTMTGYANISDNVALASMVFVLLFSGKVLLTPSAPAGPPQMPVGDNIQRMPQPRAPQYDLEHIYKLGFDDGKSGKDFGTSLPDDIIQYNAAREALPKDQYDESAENHEWAYNPPPPPKRKSSLGMGTMLSMFALYRFGKDLVTSPDGALVTDPQYVVARLRSTEPWRLGMLAMSLYRVVTALSSFAR